MTGVFKRLMPLVIFSTVAASAHAGKGQINYVRQPPQSHISFESSVVQPFAYTHFCQRYADDCQFGNAHSRGPQITNLTPVKRLELESMNAEVNDSILPLPYQGDKTYATWRIAPVYGDCNDYAVTKRHRLLALGWSPQALLLAEVITPEAIHHLVLVVRTRQHDYVLDNLTTHIYGWEDTPYEWVRIQSPYDSVLWSKVKTPRLELRYRAVQLNKALSNAKS